MASTFDNDLRLEEMATGENAGSWGTKTNTNLELIADAFGYGTFTIADADTTLTMPDGSDTDNALRSLYLKISSSADLTTTRTLTLAPNSVSKLWYIENNTSGGQTITISQGSGANVSILNGQAKLVATDGAGAGAAVIDATQDLAIPDLFIDNDLSLQSDGAIINIGADSDLQITHSGTVGTITNSTGDLTLDVEDDIILDANDEGKIQLHDNGTSYGRLDNNGGTGFDIVSTISDGDLRIRGNDGGSTIEALTFDMSAAGASTFNAGAVFNESGADSDFRVESSGNDYMLFVNAGDDKIGIQTSAPTRTVDIEGPLEADGTMYTNFRLGTDDAKEANRGAGISFGGNYRTSGNTPQTIGHIAGINGVFENGTDADYASALQFWTRKNGGSLLRNMIVGSSATVINEGGSDYDFRVESDANANMLFVDAGNSRIGVGKGSPSFTLDVEGVVAAAHYMRVDSNSGVNGSSLLTLKRDGNTDGDYLQMRDGSNNLFATFDEGGIIFNEQGGNTDFRVESDALTHALFLDAGSNQLAVGTSSPKTKAVFSGSSGTGSNLGDADTLINQANQGFITIENTDDTLGVEAGAIFRAKQNGAGAWAIYTKQTQDYIGDLMFRTRNGGSSSTEFMRLRNGSRTVEVKDTRGSAAQGPFLELNRESPTPADNDYGGAITFTANNDAAESISIADIWTRFHDVSDGAEDSRLTLRTRQAGNLLDRLTFNEAETKFNDQGGDLDFRVESDNISSALFVQGSDGNVGVGTSSPSAPLTVQAAVDNTATFVQRMSTTRGSGKKYGMEFRDSSNETNANLVINQDSSGNNSCELLLYVNKGTGGAGLQNGVQVAGFRGTSFTINENSNDLDFRVESDTSTHAIFVDAGENAIGLRRSDPAAGVSADDAIIGWGGGGQILQTSETVANGGYVDIVVNSGGGGFTGQLFVTNTVSANAAVRTHKMYFLAGRGTDCSTTELGTDTGGSGGADFSITFPSNGKIRVTNDNANSCQLVVLFIGSKAL